MVAGCDGPIGSLMGASAEFDELRPGQRRRELAEGNTRGQFNHIKEGLGLRIELHVVGIKSHESVFLLLDRGEGRRATQRMG